MATRNLLHRSHLEDFKKWLGDRALAPVGEYEVLRWKNKRPKKPMCIVFDKGSPEHYSCNDASHPEVMQFIRERKQ